MEQQPQQHFLVVTHPAQGHINPGRRLARRLACTTGARITFSTSIFAHSRMFPTVSSPGQEVEGDIMSYIPFSDGFDDGFKQGVHDDLDYMNHVKINGFKSLSALIQSLAARGRPVTFVIYAILLSWVADVAHNLGIPSVLYWIQPATAFAIYYHYFHGYEDHIISHDKDAHSPVSLPGLPPLKIRDLPSFLTTSSTDDPYSFIFAAFRELFETLDREATRQKFHKVLVNSCDVLEPDGLASVGELDLIAIGPLLPSLLMDGKGSKDGEPDLFKPDEKKYMEWLDSKPDGSVVYVSFGSLLTMKKEQLEEISRALAESGKPYLWVVRQDKNVEGVKFEEEDEGGMVVEWCSQVLVLSHPAVGCFVTHCGWNSTLESLACGVPTVCVPQWTDQATSARLVDMVWGTGVRADVNAEGVLEWTELKRCLDSVMGEGERGVEIRRRAVMWRDHVLQAVREGGSSDRNLRAFVKAVAH